MVILTNLFPAAIAALIYFNPSSTFSSTPLPLRYKEPSLNIAIESALVSMHSLYISMALSMSYILSFS